jgi:FlaA1/EpsC-like NDP-sugar epimerase
MHTDEAAYLTVKSLILAAGDVHIFDMGEPILLSTVIERMQEIAGTNIPVVVSGLREGEKLNEELHGTNETFLPTLFPGIVAANLGSSLQLAKNLETLIDQKSDKILIKKLLLGLDS